MAQFGSRIGMILATAGSAVGLGNIWRFPTTVGENGGAALILIYIFFTLILGIPGMLAEFIVGRNGKANACQSYKKSVCKLPSSGQKMGYGIGLLGMLSASLILGFYSVVAGWCSENTSGGAPVEQSRLKNPGWVAVSTLSRFTPMGTSPFRMTPLERA